MKTLAMLGCALFLCVACKSGDEAKPGGDKSQPEGLATAAGDSPTPSAGKLFGEELRKDPCALLTTEMVASVSKVPAETIEHKKASVLCIFEWEGGNASIGFITAFKSIESAETRFANAHKSMTGAEVKEAMDKIGEGAKGELDKAADKGKKTPSDKSVDTVTSGVAKSMGGGIKFEPVEGLGDQAFYDSSRHETVIAKTSIVSYANKLDVLIGNLSFSVSYSLDAPDHQGKMHKEEVIALAKLVLAGLK